MTGLAIPIEAGVELLSELISGAADQAIETKTGKGSASNADNPAVMAGIFGGTAGVGLAKAASNVIAAVKEGRLTDEFIDAQAKNFKLDSKSVKTLKNFGKSYSNQIGAMGKAVDAVELPNAGKNANSVVKNQLSTLADATEVPKGANKAATTKFKKMAQILGARVDELGGSVDDIGRIAKGIEKAKNLKMIGNTSPVQSVRAGVPDEIIDKPPKLPKSIQDIKDIKTENFKAAQEGLDVKSSPTGRVVDVAEGSDNVLNLRGGERIVQESIEEAGEEITEKGVEELTGDKKLSSKVWGLIKRNPRKSAALAIIGSIYAFSGEEEAKVIPENKEKYDALAERLMKTMGTDTPDTKKQNTLRKLDEMSKRLDRGRRK